MTGVDFLDTMVSAVLPVLGTWFVFEIGVSWFRGSIRAATDHEDEL